MHKLVCGINLIHVCGEIISLVLRSVGWHVVTLILLSCRIRVVGTAAKAIFVLTIIVGTLVLTMIVGTAVQTIIVLTASYWKSCLQKQAKHGCTLQKMGLKWPEVYWCSQILYRYVVFTSSTFFVYHTTATTAAHVEQASPATYRNDII